MVAFLMVLAYAGAAHAFWTPASAWVAADRDKYGWAVLLLIPYLNIIALVGYVLGVLPVLLPQHLVSRSNPFRRGGPGGRATTSGWPA
jgi:hypothetical protein